ncbi:ankyrin [Ascobolus immersus RN42]|uniref:Ankyrin n=1 Tax=Ascobolus immersus RN42 TaxID=1160509 RepID=A0A3N4HW94_ASCIM|nr:ankyrin [Ascobolus immersus RN42]
MPGSFPVAPDPADREGRTDLWLAASRGDVVQVKRLLDEGAQVKQSDRKGLTPLHIAAHSGFYQVVEAILRHPKQNVAEFINLQTEDHAKETALSLAVKRGIHWTVKLILDYGGKALDPNLPNGWSRTPLMEALYLRHEPIPDLRHILGTLMEKDGVIGYITADGKSALWLAVESRDHLLFFDLLHRLALPKGSGSGVADRRLIDSIKHPIFALLCKLREPEPADDPSFSFMLLKGYWQDLSSPVFTRGSFYELLCCELFRMAAEEGSFKLLPVLHHHCGGHLISTNVLIEGMMTGAKNGHTSIVEQLVHENFANRRSVNDRDSDGKSVLIAAAGSGQFKVVEWLLNKYPTEKKLFTVPVDINAVDENGRTALIVAVEGHHIDIVSLLLKEGAKLHLMTKHDLSALHIAARSGVSEFAPALDAYLQRTQDRYSVELKDPHGHSALFIAAETPGGASLIKVLLKNGASPNDPDKNTGLTPLARAVERAILDNIDALLADPNRRINQPDHKDRTPLLIAAENLLNSGKEKHAQVVLKLLKSASTRRTPKDDFRALQPEAFDILRKFSQQKSGNELLKSAIWDKIAAFMHIYKEETDQRTAQTKSYDYYENVPKPANGRSKTTGDVPIYSNYQKPPSPIINQGAPHHSPYPASEDPYGIPEYAEVRPADSRPNHRLREQRAYKEARYHHVNSYQAIPGVRTYGAANQQRIRPTGYQYAVPGRPQASRHVTEPSNSAYIRTGGHNTRRERDYREVHQSDPRTYVASGYVAQPASNDPYRAPPGYPETHPLQPPPNPVNLQHPQALRVDPSAVPRAGPSFLSPDSAYATPGPYFEQAINQRRPRSATGPGLAPMWSPGDSQYSLDPPRVSEGGGVRRHHSTGRRQAPPGRSSEDFGRKGYAPRQTPSPQPLQGGYGYRQGQLPYIAPPGDSRLPPSAPRLDDSVNPSYY